MKKFLSIILAMLLCTCLFGCDGANNSGNVIDERKSKLREAYETCCNPPVDYAELSSDGTSLVIDTNPIDKDYCRYGADASLAITLCNTKLELPSSLSDKMSSTRALDGMQSQNCGDFTVSWTYHPDNGLRVIYEVNLS